MTYPFAFNGYKENLLLLLLLTAVIFAYGLTLADVLILMIVLSRESLDCCMWILVLVSLLFKCY